MWEQKNNIWELMLKFDYKDAENFIDALLRYRNYILEMLQKKGLKIKDFIINISNFSCRQGKEIIDRLISILIILFSLPKDLYRIGYVSTYTKR